MTDPSPSDAFRGPVAYLTGSYPKASHTFIQREVAALRGLGVEVLACSVRRPPDSDLSGAAQRAEAAGTFYILRAARNPLRFLRAQLGGMVRAPRRWAGALRLALATRPPGLRALIRQLIYFAEANILADHLRRHGAVHLHNHFGDSSCTVAMLAGALGGLPYSYTEHGPTIFFAPHHWRIDEKAARARFVACISHFCRSQVMLFADPRHWDRLKLVRCGIDAARYDRGPRPGPAGGGVLFVGRLAAVKGVRLLLEAVAALRARHPGLRLTLIGDGPDRAALEAHARALGLGEAVHFAGTRDEGAVADALAQAEMLVLPSFAEGVPVVLMEAMASRLPVVATRVGGVAELVEDGVSGLLVAPGDAQALERAMDRLLGDAEARRRLGEAGRAAVCARHDSLAEARILRDLFAASAAQGDGPAPAG